MTIDEEETHFPDALMQEDEIASWLHYPTDNNSVQNNLYMSNNLLFTTPRFSSPHSSPPVQPKDTCLLHFSGPNKTTSPESSGASPVLIYDVGRERETCEMSVSLTSSLGTSGSDAGASMDSLPSSTDDRKRKPRDAVELHREVR